MRFGPAAPGPLPILVDGRSYALVVPDGRALAGIAAAGQWPQIVPGLLSDADRVEVEERLRDPADRLGLYACWRIVLGLAPEVYGVEWWAAQRLCALAQERWRDWSAWCVGHGLDVDTASAHRIVSGVWAWIGESIQEEKDLHAAEREIFDPPPELRRTRTVVPRGFSEEELAAQARQLAAYSDEPQ
ncbi:hypothetical protein EYS09_03865 [Streptomyces kasugaensis]|uniref:Uncharacterized protein n=1 Tax=Streptomyces kasugaensis TaxID=1946 RepID=A0A4Q9I0M1_STRKA|nr:hypothetical protein [Streptomyces kasugaensis]TBO60915.1 hypothetical protein EYS09_03865 [Streptomyces kasugaensis]